MKLGLSGNIARAFIGSKLSPLILLVSLAAGLLALATIPREEEPQIAVPLVDIAVNANGLSAPDATERVTKPLEAIVKGIRGVEHVYSQTRDNSVLVTVRFVVGTNEDDAVLRVQSKLQANLTAMPVGIPYPLIVGRGINDVAIVTLTLSPRPGAAGRYSDADLYRIGEKLRLALIRAENVGLTYLVGGAPLQIKVQPDPARLAEYGVTPQALAAKIEGANQAFQPGYLRDGLQYRSVEAGKTLTSPPDIGMLWVANHDGRPVYLRDLADVEIGPATQESQVWNLAPDKAGHWHMAPAVTLAIAKRQGANAVVLARDVLARTRELEGSLIPSDITVRVTRDYGRTANEKANELLLHLGIATVSIVALIAFTIGWREAMVTGIVIPATILMTLFASEVMGYTINRVSLFALIFSIGILVDDAIVVIENISRHWAMADDRSRMEAAIAAVAEVGNPTVIATLTVVAALLPMLFVSGLMGPYMAPIPVNASAAMLFSFFIAMAVVPWLMLRIAGGRDQAKAAAHHAEGGALGRLYWRVAAPLLATRRRALTLLIAVGVATLAACALFYTETVTVKLLPFDNKSELDVVLQLPVGSPLEQTERALFQAARLAETLPELRDMQAYAGVGAPFNFNGLVRHYYLRDAPQYGELQITLSPLGQRSRSSHRVALALRAALRKLALPAGSFLQVVEVPPGPPVLATLLAEIYGPDAATRLKVAQQVRALFGTVPYIVDITDSYGNPEPGLAMRIDQARLNQYGVREQDVWNTVALLLHGKVIGYSNRGEERLPVAIDLGLAKSARTLDAALLTTPVPAAGNTTIPLADVVRVVPTTGSRTLFRRDGSPADMVEADLAGRFEAPIYGMLAVDRAIAHHDWGGLPRPKVLFHGQPRDQSQPSVLWDGEWEITYVTFRDMGAAFAIAILGIYILVVAQFGSFTLPLVILTPIPLTLIGIVLGHAVFGAPFTATSMIGFIALAGIIVRNSILLVDFIRHGTGRGRTLRQILLEAGAVRFKPVLLTALSAMIGAATILTDPIFQGLAISLLFGLASSTLLTVLVVPAIYVVLRDADQVR